MYLTRQEVMVGAGRLARFEAAIDRYFELLQRQGGLVRATLLNSLGVPARHTTLEQWESRERGQIFARSAALADFIREHPVEAVSTASRPLEAYELVHRIMGQGVPDSAYFIDEIVGPGPGNLHQFEESRGEIYRLRKEFGQGFAVSLLSRFLGGANRYLIFGGFNRAGDDQKTADTAEIRRFWEEHPTAQKLVISAVRDPQVLVKTLGPDPI